MSPESRYDEDERRPRRREPEPHGFSPLAGILMVAFGIALGSVAFWAGGRFLNRERPNTPLNNPNADLREPSPTQPLDAAEREAVELFKKVKPSVVNVDIVQVRRTGFDDRTSEFQTGAGSGFIWDDDGRIVTNYHVIADYLKRRQSLIVRVVMSDRRAYDADVVGVAPDYDLAVLKFAANNSPPGDAVKKIELGTSSDLEVGQKVFAIGNPFGLSLTMTSGIISALDRTIESPTNKPIPGGIQHSAPINPGNSGGPLLDKAGRLIGVNTSITTPSSNGGNVGIGFAIPSGTVNQVVTRIIKTGKAEVPDLGIKLYDQQKLRRARYDHGVMIERTVPGGPADRAGLKGMRVNPRTRLAEPGDLIVAINGQRVVTVEDYERILRSLKPRDSATVTVVRPGGEEEVAVTVGGS